MDEKVAKAKDILSKVDPAIAVKALMRYEATLEDREVGKIFDLIKDFDVNVIAAATTDLANRLDAGRCIDEGPRPGFGPGGCGSKIIIMRLGSGEDRIKYVRFAEDVRYITGFEEVLEKASTRGAKAALKMSKESGEL